MIEIDKQQTSSPSRHIGLLFWCAIHEYQYIVYIAVLYTVDCICVIRKCWCFWRLKEINWRGTV